MIGAFTGVHQFCRIGRHAFIGPYSVVTQDVLPYSMTVGKREISVFGANRIGLERRGFREPGDRSAANCVPPAHARATEHHAGHRAHPRRGPGVPRSRGIARVHPHQPARCREVIGGSPGNGPEWHALRPDRRQRPLPDAGAGERPPSSGSPSPCIAIKEEASPEIEALADRCYWISIGQLGKLIDICHKDRHHRSDDVRAGEARQNLLLHPPGLAPRQTARQPAARRTPTALIGGVIKVLADEGIHLRDSTLLLKPLLADRRRA